ncbi:(2Fe-2S)-binding protein [Schlesneria sp. DSM 10557]|uniref:(2Fe-2S)-binding protein n=1 Tax=Schlesneria sp. DSM 10557 TaxID=3044399 RepID=UPI0035A156AD
MISSAESTTVTQNHACEGTCSSCGLVGSCAVRTVCRCLKVAEDTIIEAIRTGGATSVRDLKLMTGAGDGCAACHRHLKQYLAIYLPPVADHSTSSPSMC